MIHNDMTLQEAYQKYQKVFFMLLLGCLSFSGVIFFMISQGGSVTSSADNHLLKYIAYAWMPTALLLSLMVKNVLLSKKENYQQYNHQQKISKLGISLIIPIAIVESAVFLGIITAFFSRNVMDMLFPLIVLGVGFFTHFPKFENWQSWYEGK